LKRDQNVIETMIMTMKNVIHQLITVIFQNMKIHTGYVCVNAWDTWALEM